MNATLASAWERTHLTARGALVALALTACGSSTDGASQSSTTVSDTPTAYLKLSDDVKACQDDKDTCVTDAAADATKLAACDDAAKSCIEKTGADQDQARKHLRDDAEGCVRECRGGHHHDGAGGAGGTGGTGGASTDDSSTVADGGTDDTRGCFGRRNAAPAFNSACADDFFKCLDDTGIRMSSAGTTLDDATKAAIGKCVETAHGCFMDDMMTHGGRGPGGPGHGDKGEAGQGGSGGPGRGGPGFPGRRGAAGEPAHDAAGAGGHGHFPGFPHEAGAGGDTGRGRGRGDAAGEDPDRRHRGGQAGEAADAGI